MEPTRVQILGDDGTWTDLPGVTVTSITLGPEPAPQPIRLTAEQAQACVILARRLVDRHHLTAEQAVTAAVQAALHEDGPHADLARQEAAAILAEIGKAMAPFVDAFRRMAGAAAKAAQGMRLPIKPPAGHQVHPALPAVRERPAWQSPYGPPQRRHA